MLSYRLLAHSIATDASAQVTVSLTTACVAAPAPQCLHSETLASTRCQAGIEGLLPLSLLPIGSPDLLINTHALSSNFTTLPSGRWYFLAVRTTTACRMSPLRTLLAAEMETAVLDADSGPNERCFWTTQMMRSPENARSQHLHVSVSTTKISLSLQNCLRVWYQKAQTPHVFLSSSSQRTDRSGALHLQDFDAFNNSSARVVDAIEH